MGKPNCQGAKSTRFHYTTKLILLLAILTGAIAFWIKAGNNLVSTNRARDVQPNAVAEKKWAAPLQLPGAPNLHKVSEDLYRGSQPTAEGMIQLKQLGVKTVVNLRSFHSDRDEIGSTGLAYEHIYMKAWHPEDKEVVRFMQIATEDARTPVFIHCQHGADRTGTMCAIYRIAVQGWTKEEAIDEMTKGGFGFHQTWHNMVDYIRQLDIDKIKSRAGLN